jgi:hypothetical protein
MKRIFLGLLFAAFACCSASAQNARIQAQAVATCGAQSLTAGVFYPATQDLTGTLCTSAGGGGGGGLAIVDGATFTPNTSTFTPIGGEYNATPTTCTSGDQCTAALTVNRELRSHDADVLAAVNSPIPPQTTNAVNIGAVMNAGSTYETVAASQTGQILGGAGAVGDYLSHCVIYPTTTTPGVVTVFDDASAAGSNVIAFPGGASSVSNLAPIAIPVGAVSVTGEWRVTTGANLVVTCYGKFT